MAVGTLSNPPVGERAATPTITSSPSNQPSSQPTGALPGGTNAASCKIYSPAAVASMPLAFDGTVAAIGESRIDPQDSWIRLVTTSFTVHEWYRGGAGETVTVEIPVGDSIDPGPPPFDIGTRLLVSGRGRVPGAPNEKVVAWGCGFTRYYDIATADRWRAATR